MAAKCQFGNHGKCASCGTNYITANSDHIHVHLTRSGRIECVCGTCWGILAIAANTILQATREDLKGQITPEKLQQFLTERVIVLIQAEL